MNPAIFERRALSGSTVHFPKRRRRDLFNRLRGACRRLLQTIAVASVFLGNAASAVVIGPVYPPPGLISYSSSGSAIRSGGSTAIYSIDLSQTGDLWWGPTDDFSIGLALDGHVDRGTSEIMARTGGFGASSIEYFSSNVSIATTSGMRTYLARFEMQVSDLLGNPLAFQKSYNALGGSPGSDFPVLQVLQDFKVTKRFEMNDGIGSGWIAAGDFYDNIPGKLASGQLATSFNAGFFYTENVSDVPEPMMLGLLATGVIGIGLSHRHRLERRVLC